jgi:ubiquinone/menaquinone biosynthesis C-methylase UbiE
MKQDAHEAARRFADAVVDAVFAAWAEDLVARVGLRPGERVLDVGCGTGAVARAAVPLVGSSGQVVGSDPSADRIAVAATLPTPDGATIEWRQGDATAMPFYDESFDVVLCQQVLHLIPDRAAALSEMRRVLMPGGRLGLSVWQSMEHSPAFLPIAAAVAQHLGAEEAARFGRNFSLADAAEVQRLLEAAGFTDVDIVQEEKIADFARPDDFIDYQMDVNAERWHIGDAVRSALVSEIRTGLQPLIESGRLRFPRGAHIATARRP